MLFKLLKLFLIVSILFQLISFKTEALADHSKTNLDNWLHFSHPLIAESPSPDTKIRFDYFFLDVDGEVEDEELGEEGEGPSRFKDHTIRLEMEYAFTRSISIEANIPYTFLDVDEGPNKNRLNHIEVGLKLATFILERYGILLGGGIELGLPPGDDDEGIGSDNIIEIEPFIDMGFKYQDFEFISFLTLGFPVNQNSDQDEGDELGYNFSFLYHLTDFLEIILEFDGETVLNGEENGESVFNIDPGIKIAPFRNKGILIGFGSGFPLTDDEEFKYRLIGSIFYHFQHN